MKPNGKAIEKIIGHIKENVGKILSVKEIRELFRLHHYAVVLALIHLEEEGYVKRFKSTRNYPRFLALPHPSFSKEPEEKDLYLE